MNNQQPIQAGFAYAGWAKESSDDDLRGEARLQTAVGSNQLLRIKIVKDEMARRGLNYTDTQEPEVARLRGHRP